MSDSVDPLTFISQQVSVNIDRPLGSRHPKHGFLYEVNYGYVPGTISGDGEELDVYVLGVTKPLETFDGKCIAVIRRLRDRDDKLIVVPTGSRFSEDEIRRLTDFQERFFESEVVWSP